MKALVFLNGECDLSDDDIRSYAADSDGLFCADGGARHIHRIGLVPTLVAGDMDSIGRDLLDWFSSAGVEMKKFLPDKDSSDAELLFEILFSRGYREITVLGALGGRIDHAMGNIFLLERLSAMGISIRIIGRGIVMEVVRGEKRLRGRKGSIFSLFSLTDTSTVTLYGFKYPLSFSRVKRGTTVGLSNIIESDDALVVVHDGDVVTIIQEEKR